MRSALKAAGIVMIAFLVLWAGEELYRRKIGGFGGSYPFVQTWELPAPEGVVTDIVRVLSQSDTVFRPPSGSELILQRGTGERDYWQYLTFYYPATDELVHGWTRPARNPGRTTLALVGFSKRTNPTDYRFINRDFWYLPNHREIEKFRKMVVEPIQSGLERKSN